MFKVGDWIVQKVFRRKYDPDNKESNMLGYYLIRDGYTYPAKILSFDLSMKGTEYAECTMIGQLEKKRFKVLDSRLASKMDFDGQILGLQGSMIELETQIEDLEKVQKEVLESIQEIENEIKR